MGVEEPEILAGMYLLFPNNIFGYTITTLGMFKIDLDKLFHDYILNVCLFIYFVNVPCIHFFSFPLF